MPNPINAADVEGLQEAISGDADVMAAAALRHAQAHGLTSGSDHSDVSGTAPQAGQVLVYDATLGRWTPRALTVEYTGADIDEGTC